MTPAEDDIHEPVEPAPSSSPPRTWRAAMGRWTKVFSKASFLVPGEHENPGALGVAAERVRVVA